MRDASGRLTQVDVRPVNFDRVEKAQVRWGATWSKRLGGAAVREGRSGAGQDGGARSEAGAPRAGGEGGGLRGGGFGGGRNQGRLQLSLFHTYRLEDRVVIRPGLPEIDRLAGDAFAAGGGTPRNELDLLANYAKNGLGARLSARWREGTSVQGRGGGGSALDFSDLTTADLRLFADLGQRREWVRERPWLRGLRVSLDVKNLLDARQEVQDVAGKTPVQFQPDYLDPVGRTLTVGVRKIFLPRRPAPRAPRPAVG